MTNMDDFQIRQTAQDLMEGGQSSPAAPPASGDLTPFQQQLLGLAAGQGKKPAAPPAAPLPVSDDDQVTISSAMDWLNASQTAAKERARQEAEASAINTSPWSSAMDESNFIEPPMADGRPGNQPWGMLTPEAARTEVASNLKNEMAGLEAAQRDPDLQGTPGNFIDSFFQNRAKSFLESTEQRVGHSQAQLAGKADLPEITPVRNFVERIPQSAVTSVAQIPRFAGVMSQWLREEAGGFDLPGAAVTGGAMLSSPGDAGPILKQAGDMLEAWAKKTYPGDAARQEESGSKVASFLGFMASLYGAGAIKAVTAGGPAAVAQIGSLISKAGSVSMAVAPSAMSQYDAATEVMRKQAAPGAVVDDAHRVTERDRKLATLAGAGLGLSFLIPLGSALATPAERAAGEIFAQGLKGGGVTSLQMTGFNVLSNLTAKTFYDPNRSPTEGMQDDALLGFLFGGLTHGYRAATSRPPLATEAEARAFADMIRKMAPEGEARSDPFMDAWHSSQKNILPSPEGIDTAKINAELKDLARQARKAAEKEPGHQEYFDSLDKKIDEKFPAESEAAAPPQQEKAAEAPGEGQAAKDAGVTAEAGSETPAAPPAETAPEAPQTPGRQLAAHGTDLADLNGSIDGLRQQQLGVKQWREIAKDYAASMGVDPGEIKSAAAAPTALRKIQAAALKAQGEKETLQRLAGQDVTPAPEATLAAAYGEPHTIVRAAASKEPSVQGLAQAMSETAPGVATLNAGIQMGEVDPSVDIAPQMSETLRIVAEIKKQGATPDSYFAGKTVDFTVEQMVRAFHEHPNAAKAAGKVIRNYVQAAIQQEQGGDRRPAPAAVQAIRASAGEALKGRGEGVPAGIAEGQAEGAVEGQPPVQGEALNEPGDGGQQVRSGEAGRGPASPSLPAGTKPAGAGVSAGGQGAGRSAAAGGGRQSGSRKPVTEYTALADALKVKTSVEAATANMPDKLKRAVRLISQHLPAIVTAVGHKKGQNPEPLPEGTPSREARERDRWDEANDHLAIAANGLAKLRQVAREVQRLSGEKAVAAVEPLILAVKTLAAIKKVGPAEYWDEIAQTPGKSQAEIQAAFDRALAAHMPMAEWENSVGVTSREVLQPMIDAAIKDGRLRLSPDGKLRWGVTEDVDAPVPAPRPAIIPPEERIRGMISAFERSNNRELAPNVRAEAARLEMAMGQRTLFQAAMAETRKSIHKRQEWADLAAILGVGDRVKTKDNSQTIQDMISARNSAVIEARQRAAIREAGSYALKGDGALNPLEAIARRLQQDLAGLSSEGDIYAIKQRLEANIERDYGLFTADLGRIKEGSKSKSVQRKADKLRAEIDAMMAALGFPAQAFGNARRLSVDIRKDLGGNEGEYAPGSPSGRYSDVRLASRRGPTTLGHEWFHGLDHAIGGSNAHPLRMQRIAFMSMRKGKGPTFDEKFPVLAEARKREHAGTGARPEVQQAWDDLYNAVYKGSSDAAQIMSAYDRLIVDMELVAQVKREDAAAAPNDEYAALAAELAVQKTEIVRLERRHAEAEVKKGGKGAFALIAELADLGEGGRYWAQPEELMARAFESYLSHRLGIAGPKGRTFQILDSDKTAIYAAFDSLFNTLKLRETPQGPEFYALRGFHSSPADFDKFSSEYIGKGQGWGHRGPGLYFGSTEEVSKYYGRIVASYNGSISRTARKALDSNEGDIDKAIKYVKKLQKSYKNNEYVYNQFKEAEVELSKKQIGRMYEADINVDKDKVVIGDKKIVDQPIGADIKKLLGNYDHNKVNAESWKLGDIQQYNPLQDGLRPNAPKNVDDLTGEQAIAVLRINGMTNDELVKAGIKVMEYPEHDDVILGKRSYVVFDSSSVSISSKRDGMYSLRGFYNPAIRAADAAKQSKATGDQWAATLRNTPGVQARHLEELGINDWLKEQKGPVSKAELLAEMQVREAPLEEQVRGAGGPRGKAAEDALNAYLDAQFETGATRAELRRLQVEADAAKYRAKEELPKYSDYTPFGNRGDNPREFIIRDPRLAGQYDEPHFGGPALLHMRTWDITGPKGEKLLGVAEVQSTMHQEGRAKGYAAEFILTQEARLAELGGERDRLEAKYNSMEMRDKDGDIVENTGPEAQDVWRRLSEVYAEIDAMDNQQNAAATPIPAGAPLKGDAWLELGLKRALQLASEEGYDGITWARSDQIARAVSADPAKMAVQYDQKIGSFLKKYGKKWGVQVESADLGLPGKTPADRLDSSGVAKAAAMAREEAARLGTSRLEQETRDWLTSFASDPTIFMDEHGAFDPGQMESEAKSMVAAIFDRYKAPKSSAVNQFIRITDQMRKDFAESGQAYALAAGDAPRAPEFSPAFQEAWPEVAQRVADSIQEMVPGSVSVRVNQALLSMGAEGYANPAKGLIELAFDTGDSLRGAEARMAARGRHEVTHIMREAGAYTEPEWKTLVERAKKIGAPEKIEASGAGPRYRALYTQQAQAAVRRGALTPDDIPEYVREQMDQEYVGHMAEEFEKGSRFGAAIDKLLARMRQILDAVFRALRDLGFTKREHVFATADDILASTFSGERTRRMDQAGGKGELDAAANARSAQELRRQPGESGVGSAARAGEAGAGGAGRESFALGGPRIRTVGARLVDGYRGFISDRGPGRSGLGRRSYYLYPESTRELTSGEAPEKALGKSLGYLHAQEVDPGVWVAGDTALQAGGADLRGKGIGAKLYDAVERDLRTTLQPSGILLDNGYRFWLKRNAKAVEFYQQLPFENDGTYYSPLRLLDMLHEFEDLRARTGDVRILAKLEQQQRQTQAAFDTLPDDVKAETAAKYAGNMGGNFAFGRSKKKAAPDIKPLAQQIENLRQALGITMTKGLWSARVRGVSGGWIFKTRPGPAVKSQYDVTSGDTVMRYRAVKSLDELAAQGGRHLEARYGKPLQDFLEAHRSEIEPMGGGANSLNPLSDGFSAFFKQYLLDPVLAKKFAPSTYGDFGDFLDQTDPGMFQKVESIQLTVSQKDYQDYISATNIDRARADVATTITKSTEGGGVVNALKSLGKLETLTGFASRQYTNFLDESHPVREIVSSFLRIADANGVKDADGLPISLKYTENSAAMLKAHQESFKIGLMHFMNGVPNWMYSDAGWQVFAKDNTLLQTFTTRRGADEFAKNAGLGEKNIRAAKEYRSKTLFDAMKTFTGGKPRWDRESVTAFGAYLESRRGVEEWKSYEAKLSRLQSIERGLESTQQYLSGMPKTAAQAKAPGARELLSKAEQKLDRRRIAIAQQQKLVQEYERDLAAILKQEKVAVAEGITTGIERQKEARSIQFRNDLRNQALQVNEDLDQARQTLQDKQKEAVALKAEAEQHARNIANAEKALDRLRELRGEVREGGLQREPHAKTRSSHEDVIAQTEVEYPGAKEAAEAVYDFLKQSAIYDFQAGMITKEQLDHYLSRSHFYVPWWRDLGDKIASGRRQTSTGPGVPVWDSSKQTVGGNAPVINPLEAIIELHQFRVARADFNRIIVAMANLAERAGPAAADIAEVWTRRRIVDNDPDGFSFLKNAFVKEGYDAADAHEMASRVAADYADMSWMLEYRPGAEAKTSLKIPFMKNGERHYLQINDPEWAAQMHQALMGMGREMTNTFIDAMGKFSLMLSGPIWANPAFSSVHAFRTIGAAGVLTADPLRPSTWPGVAQYVGMKHLLSNSHEAQLYHEAGGPMGVNSQHLSRTRDRLNMVKLQDAGHRINPWWLTASTSAGALLGGGLSAATGSSPAAGALVGAYFGGVSHRGRTFEDMAGISDATEMATRMGVWDAAVTTAIRNNPDLTPAEAYQEAAQISRSVFDPTPRGAKMFAVLRTVAFGSAHINHVNQTIQKMLASHDRGLGLSPLKMLAGVSGLGAAGLAVGGPLGLWAGVWGGKYALTAAARYTQTGRRALAPFGQKPEEKVSREQEAAYGTALKVGTMLMAMTAIYTVIHLLMEGDPEYDGINAEFKERWQPFKLLGQWTGIPRAFQLGVPAATLQAALDAQLHDDPRMWERMRGSIFDSIIPPLMPQAFNLYMGVSSGKDTFSGRDIVPPGMRGKLIPQEQYDKSTSEIAKLLSKAINSNETVKSAVEGLGGTVFKNKKFEVSPFLIDWSVKSMFGYFGKDALNAGGLVIRSDSPAAQRISAFPILGTLVGRWTLNPYEQHDAVRLFWEKAGKDISPMRRAATQYAYYLNVGTGKPGVHTGMSEDEARVAANTFLAHLHPEDRAYALVENSASSWERRMHPVNRLKQIIGTVNQMNTDMMQNGLSDTSAKRGTSPIAVSPDRYVNAKDLLTQYAASEAQNTFVALKMEQFAHYRRELDAKGVLNILKAAEPKIYDELQTRLQRQRVADWDDVKSSWPDIEHRLLKDWHDSVLNNEPVSGVKIPAYQPNRPAVPQMEEAQ